MTDNLFIERGATGFIVGENPRSHAVGRKWGFTSPEELADFVTEWASDGGEESTTTTKSHTISDLTPNTSGRGHS